MTIEPTFRTKIAAVRFKNGGELRLMPNPRESASALVESWLRREIAHHVEVGHGQLAGAVLVTWHADGSISSGFMHEHTSPYTGSAIPHLVAEGVRKVQQKIAINRALGREDDAG